jgi:hypothetical protein
MYTVQNAFKPVTVRTAYAIAALSASMPPMLSKKLHAIPAAMV